MPKVLRIMNRLNLGGPTFNAAYLTKYMAPRYETYLLAGQKDDSEASSEFIVKELGLTPQYVRQMYRSLNPFKDILAYFEIKRLIKTYKPDVVHTHAAKSGALGRLAAAACGVPVIVHTFHGHVFHSYFGYWKTRFFLAVERFLAKKTTKIIAISTAQQTELCDTFKIAPAEKFVVVPLGFDLDRFQTQQAEKRAQFRAAFQLKETDVAIGIVGRLVPIKNHALFLEALAYVKQNSAAPFKAFIVGDGETRAALEAQAQALGLDFGTPDTPERTLIFTSWRKDIDVVNAGLDIIALTSLNEGTPVSLIEAQAANKPIVSTRVGGIGDIVLENETALLSDIEDSTQFCAHLLALVNDPDKRQKMGEKGYEHVQNTFSYQRLVRDMTALYDDLLSKTS